MLKKSRRNVLKDSSNEQEHKDRVESLLHQQETPKAEPMRYTTASVLPYLDRQTKHKVITLDLDQGPYKTNMTGNGLYMGIAGRKGHIGILDWKQQNLITEFNVGENIYDFHFFILMICMLLLKKIHYIYDSDGTSLHNLREFIQPRYLDFYLITSFLQLYVLEMLGNYVI
ncbi:U3 small nucleolar RNA-associated protein 7 [Entamoeba marina]